MIQKLHRSQPCEIVAELILVGKDVLGHLVDKSEAHLITIVDIVRVAQYKSFIEMVHDNFEAVLGEDKLVHCSHDLILLVQDVEYNHILNEELVYSQFQYPRYLFRMQKAY